jgi:hypothetical protein
MAHQSPRVVATIIWAALLAGPTVFLGVALFIVFGLRGGAGVGVGVPLAQPALMIGGSLALSVVTVALSWLWAVRMRIAPPAQGGQRGAAAGFPPGPEANAVARLVVACALCEGGALAAIIVFMQTGEAPALASYALSWLALAAHFPGDRHWAQLTGGPTGAARNPMIRG